MVTCFPNKVMSGAKSLNRLFENSSPSNSPDAIAKILERRKVEQEEKIAITESDFSLCFLTWEVDVT